MADVVNPPVENRVREGHKPDKWYVVSEQSNVIIMSAGCICGHPDCSWTTSTYSSDWTNDTPEDIARYRRMNAEHRANNPE